MNFAAAARTEHLTKPVAAEALMAALPRAAVARRRRSTS
jgi:hypothetical protein